MKDENMISKLEFINENEYVSKNFKKSAFLNLIEAYETLDIEGRGFIHISLLQKHAPTIKQNMMADEENLFNTLITAHTVELNFSDFFKLYSGQIKRKTLSIKDIKALAKRIGKNQFQNC
jgi:Ca2+-binding EF-hand superfamily protein